MDYKGPPQYAQPGQNGTPAPQYSSPAPQYGQPVSPPAHPQQYVQAPPVQQPVQQQQPQYVVHPQQQPQYGQPAPQQQGVVQYAQPPQHQQQQPIQYVQQQPIQQVHAKVEHPQQYAQPHPGAQPAQYQSPAPMQRAVVTPGAKGGDWSTSLMDCSPCDTCLLATCLPCVLLGQTSDRMRDPTMATADALNSECLVFTAIQCFTGCGWIYIMMKRSEIRETFGMQGDGTSDCCVTYWCPCCALIQQDKEVKVRTSNAAGLITQGYQAQGGMQMPQIHK